MCHIHYFTAVQLYYKILRFWITDSLGCQIKVSCGIPYNVAVTVNTCFASCYTAYAPTLNENWHLSIFSYSHHLVYLLWSVKKPAGRQFHYVLHEQTLDLFHCIYCHSALGIEVQRTSGMKWWDSHLLSDGELNIHICKLSWGWWVFVKLTITVRPALATRLFFTILTYCFLVRSVNGMRLDWQCHDRVYIEFSIAGGLSAIFVCIRF